MTKPFAFAELLVRVKALLRREPVNRSSTLRIGILQLDRLTQQVKRAGKRIDLTAKEYSLLEYLMQNPDHVLSRNMIMEHVWDQSLVSREPIKGQAGMPGERREGYGDIANASTRKLIIGASKSNSQPGGSSVSPGNEPMNLFISGRADSQRLRCLRERPRHG